MRPNSIIDAAVDVAASEDVRLAERRLAEATRGLVTAFADTAAPASLLAEATEAITQLRTRFEAHEQIDHTKALDTRERHRRTAFTGPASVITPMMRFEIISNNEVDAFVHFDRPFEGPPGRVHGGYISAAFDVALARAQSVTGHMAMTVDLRVRYLRGTPLLQPLRIACRLDGVEGQRVHTSGAIYNGAERCAEADGVFHMGRRRERVETPER